MHLKRPSLHDFTPKPKLVNPFLWFHDHIQDWWKQPFLIVVATSPTSPIIPIKPLHQSKLDSTYLILVRTLTIIEAKKGRTQKSQGINNLERDRNDEKHREYSIGHN